MNPLLLTLLLLFPTQAPDSLKTIGELCEEAYLANRPDLMQPLLGTYERLLDRTELSDSLLVRYEKGHLEKLKGNFYFCLADGHPDYFSRAQEHYRRARRLYPEQLDASIRARHTLGMDLAQLYYRQKDYARAEQELEPLVFRSPSRQLALEAIGPYALCLARNGRFGQALQMVRQVPASDADRERKMAKILALEAESEGRRSEASLRLYKSYFEELRRRLPATLSALDEDGREALWMWMKPFATDCMRTEHLDPAFLYDVVLLSKDLLLQLRRKDVFRAHTWQAVQAALRPGQAAVEFIQYEVEGKERMAALVLKAQGQPVFVPVGALEELLYQPIQAGLSLSVLLDHPTLQAVDTFYEHPASRELLWPAALLSCLEDCHEIWFSPDGFQHIVGIEYCFPAREKEPVLHRVTGTGLLVDRRPASPVKKALLVGDVRFNGTPANESGDNDENAYWLLARRKGSFHDLPYSGNEIDSIALHIRGNKTLLRGNDAGEDRLRSVIGQYDLIHLATHGYFSTGEIPLDDGWKTPGRDPSLSGNVLILAGGNKNLHDPHFRPEHTADGILSAREISRLSLEGNGLVVLSACQSGLGTVTATGVSGMQKGWKIAGAGTMVMSLWNVHDEATSCFMQAFYAGLEEGLPARAAFERARERMKEPYYKDIRRFNTRKMRSLPTRIARSWEAPRYRNAFILIDD